MGQYKKLHLLYRRYPNAFATGRDPEHAVVAVTEGILRLLPPEELRGVVAHEMGHVVNRDILIQTVAGVMASAIVTLANIFQFTAIFGGGRDGEGGGNPIGALALALLAPMAGGFGKMEFLLKEAIGLNRIKSGITKEDIGVKTRVQGKEIGEYRF